MTATLLPEDLLGKIHRFLFPAMHRCKTGTFTHTVNIWQILSMHRQIILGTAGELRSSFFSF